MRSLTNTLDNSANTSMWHNFTNAEIPMGELKLVGNLWHTSLKMQSGTLLNL